MSLEESARRWVVHHWSRNRLAEETSDLLREVAHDIDELGDIELLDVSVSFNWEPDGQRHVNVTVYFDFGDNHPPESR